MTPNIDLLRQTMDEILAHPEQHRQLMWATRTDCGTAYCFAGMACHLSGLKPNFDRATEDRPDETYWLTDGREVEDAARQLLGLDDASAHVLFAAGNEVSDLKHYVDKLSESGSLRWSDRDSQQEPF